MMTFGKKRNSSSKGSLAPEEQLTRGWAVERGGNQPLQLPLIGVPPPLPPRVCMHI